jgi:hypothetical protein
MSGDPSLPNSATTVPAHRPSLSELPKAKETQNPLFPRFGCFFANYSRLVKNRQVGQGPQLTQTDFPIFKRPNQLAPAARRRRGKPHKPCR